MALAAADAERGAVLAGLGGCLACHTADSGQPGAGGHRIKTPYGTFVGSNITPDPLHGLGTWSLADFDRAMRKGKSPDGRAYWPAFPWPSFSELTDEDVDDLWAWVQSLEPSARPDEPHELERGYRGRLKAGLWRTFVHRQREVLPDDESWSEEVRRGAYLVNTLGHCGGCHSPRTRLGREDATRRLAGGDTPPYRAPNLTPHADGLATWTDDDWSSFLEMGMLPDGDFTGRGMARVVNEGTSLLTTEDREAMAAYLRQLTPHPDAEPE